MWCTPTHRRLAELVDVFVPDASGVDVPLRIRHVERPADDVREVAETLARHQGIERRVRALGRCLHVCVAHIHIAERSEDVDQPLMADVVRRNLLEPAQEERVHRRNVGDDVEKILAVTRSDIERVEDCGVAYERQRTAWR
jgi:hypothetical protein